MSPVRLGPNFSPNVSLNSTQEFELGVDQPEGEQVVEEQDWEVEAGAVQNDISNIPGHFLIWYLFNK